jgi:hypothetical protein
VGHKKKARKNRFTSLEAQSWFRKLVKPENTLVY